MSELYLARGGTLSPNGGGGGRVPNQHTMCPSTIEKKEWPLIGLSRDMTDIGLVQHSR